MRNIKLALLFIAVILLVLTRAPLATAHNKVVVVPLGADDSIDMQCQDGGINQYGDCLSCTSAEGSQCCSDETVACLADTDCLALNLCVSGCGTSECVENCKAARSASTVALHEAISLCLFGSGEPNLDGACGLVCAPPPGPD